MAERSRSVAWLRDELILVLDLYMDGEGNTTGPERDEASALLRSIPVEAHLAGDPAFRSRAAVARKIGNFAALDPSNRAGGLEHGGRGDREVWTEFAGDRSRLRGTAAAIRANLSSVTRAEADLVEDEIADAPEGRVLTRTHRVRERNAKLVEQRKIGTRQAHGHLSCEGCGFNFEVVYGERGADFIECHHTIPIASLRPQSRTRLADLALICSNCHRMIHRRAPWLTMGELRSLLAEHSPAGAAQT